MGTSTQEPEATVPVHCILVNSKVFQGIPQKSVIPLGSSNGRPTNDFFFLSADSLKIFSLHSTPLACSDFTYETFNGGKLSDKMNNCLL